MQSYFWVKTFHLVFVVAWMATVFYLPRILVNLAEAGAEPAVRARLREIVWHKEERHHIGEAGFVQMRSRTADLEVEQSWRPEGSGHQLTWGGGLRHHRDHNESLGDGSFTPARRPKSSAAKWLTWPTPGDAY